METLHSAQEVAFPPLLPLPDFSLHTNEAGKCPLSTSTLSPGQNLEIKGFTVAFFFLLKPHSLNGIKSASLLKKKKVASFCIRTLWTHCANGPYFCPHIFNNLRFGMTR